MATNNNSTKQKSSTKNIWTKARPYYFGSKKLGIADILGAAFHAGNNTSLYYDPTTGTYIDRDTAKSQLWEKNHPYLNAIYDSYDSGQYAQDLLAKTGVENPYVLKTANIIGSLAPYAIPVYGVTKMANDVGKNIFENVLDYNRDMDMIKDLRYGDLGYSNKWLLEDGGSPIWEGIKTASANDWFHDLTGWGRRTGFSEQSDVYKLGQQTTIKMMQKMLEDTGNFDPANAKSRGTLNQFNMMNQLLKNSDAYWQFQNIKNSQDMSNEDFNAYLEAAGIDENTYKGMEYAAKQLYNLGDNQERNGLRYDPKFNFSTNTPMIQYMYARKQKPIKDDPLAGLVGGSHVLDGYTKVGDNFVDIKTGENLVPEIEESVNQNTPTQEATTSVDTAATDTATNTTTTTANDTKENAVNTVKDTPNYVKAGFYEFPKEYTRRTGYDFANNPYNIWK